MVASGVTAVNWVDRILLVSSWCRKKVILPIAMPYNDIECRVMSDV